MSTAKPVRLSALALVTLLLGVSVAQADECQDQEAAGLAVVPASSVIPVPPTSRCYGAAGENNALTKEIRRLVDPTPPAPGNLSQALRELASHVRTDGTYGDDAVRERYADLAQRAAAGIESGVGPGNDPVATADWQVNGGRTKALPQIDVLQILNDSCGQTPPGATPTPACQGGINRAKGWLRVFQLTERTLTQYSAPAINALLQRSTTRLAMWHAYRDDGLPQFQWEWLLNSWRHNKSDDRKRDAAGQPIGPMKVPTDQIIFLHPGVGLEYRDKANRSSGSDDSKTSPLVYLELIGRNRWSWNENTGEMIGGSGISLVATYADRNHDTKVGYGLLFHSRLTKNYTFGITRSGDSTNIVFNADLAEFFKDKMAYWKGVEEIATK
jgi:hypothetical protein